MKTGKCGTHRCHTLKLPCQGGLEENYVYIICAKQKYSTIHIILTKAGISLHWVPEVFSRVRRGASDTAHEKPLAPRVAFHTSFLVFPLNSKGRKSKQTTTTKQ